MLTRKIIVVALALVSGSALASEGTSVGVMLGTPNGITARHWISEDQSVDAGAGWSLSKSRFQLHSDFLWNKPGLIEIGQEKFDLYFGGGLSLRTRSGSADNEVVFGPRLPIGAAYEFTQPDIELFTQLALNVGIVPSSDIYLDANVGIRFFF